MDRRERKAGLGLAGPPVLMEWTPVVASVTIINLASWLKKKEKNIKKTYSPSPLLTYNFLRAESTRTQSAHYLLMSPVFQAGTGTCPGQ